MATILPSLIAGDLLNLSKDISSLEPFCSKFHIDVMDFHFVPNLAFGPDFVNAIKNITKNKLEIHMMVQYPEKYVGRLNLTDGDIFTFHIESPSDLSPAQLIREINSKNWLSSIALSPNTPLEALFSIDAPFDRVLLVSVEPGFSGQDFLPHMKLKLKSLSLFRQSHGLNFTIAIDGGITKKLCQELVDLGADELVVGSAIFKNTQPAQALKDFNQN